jgi:hypothetical protein
MKKLLLTTLCSLGLSGCTVNPPVEVEPVCTLYASTSVAGKISGDTVSILNFPPLTGWIADDKERDQRYQPLIAELKNRNPEQDANAAITRGEHYLLGEWVGVNDGSNVYWNKERARSGKQPVVSYHDVMDMRACELRLLEGLIGQGSPPPNAYSTSIPSVYAQYQSIAQHYSERWNGVMIPICRADLQVEHAKQRDAAEQERQQAKRKWQQSKLLNYTYTLEKSCFCMEEERTPREVTVKNGVVVSALQLPEKKRSVMEYATTVDELFERIRTANTTREVGVKYHPQYGYPLAVSFHPRVRGGMPIPDSGSSVTISNLHAIPPTEKATP